MTFTIILFFIALASAIGLIARKAWMLRTGRLVIEPSYEEADWTELSVETIRIRLIEALKFSIHHAALYALKLWILTSHHLKRFDRFVNKKLLHFLHKHGKSGATIASKPSAFLKDIKAHKAEVSESLQKESSSEQE